MASTSSLIQLLRSQTLSGLVQEEVLRRIKSGVLNSGQKLNEADLADTLSISRSPVREAFSALEEAGLVTLTKNRGAFIREVSDAEALELYQVRAALDDAAGRRLAPVITDAQLEELRTRIAALESGAREGLNVAFPLNIAFHDRIVEMAGNATLLRIYRQTVDRMHLLRRRGFLGAGASEASHREHRQIVAALALRDPAVSAAAMREHVTRGFERTFEMRWVDQGSVAAGAAH